jgi:polyisoprenoid-binding protein YceI
MSLKRWLIAGAVVVVLVVVGGPFVYINFIQEKAPPKLGLSIKKGTTATTAGSGASVPLDGKWTVTTGSQAGYRVNEVLFGQKSTAVGRTTAVTGSITINGTTCSNGSFTVDLTKVASDKDRRDRQFQGRIMNTATYPTATFTASGPIDFKSVPNEGATMTVDVPGQLAMHGATKPVTIHLGARRTASNIEVSGSVPVTFADWNIPNPSFSGVVSTEDHGTMEFLLNFAHA